MHPTSRSGVHVLRSTQTAARIVACAGLHPGHLVLDLGAGPGTFVEPLAATGARVLAVERDRRFIATLHRRFDALTNVRIVETDLRRFRFPERPFQVVASPPFALSTPLLREMLDPRRSGLRRADLVVEWGFAKRMLDQARDGAELRRWRRWYRFELVERIPPSAFRPPPAVACAHLTITRTR